MKSPQANEQTGDEDARLAHDLWTIIEGRRAEYARLLKDLEPFRRMHAVWGLLTHEQLNNLTLQYQLPADLVGDYIKDSCEHVVIDGVTYERLKDRYRIDAISEFTAEELRREVQTVEEAPADALELLFRQVVSTGGIDLSGRFRYNQRNFLRVVRLLKRTLRFLPDETSIDEWSFRQKWIAWLDSASAVRFVNRNKQMEQLSTLARFQDQNSSTPIINLSGQPGIGKTALVRQFLHREWRNGGAVPLYLDLEIQPPSDYFFLSI